jgi:hypothetical protein
MLIELISIGISSFNNGLCCKNAILFTLPYEYWKWERVCVCVCVCVKALDLCYTTKTYAFTFQWFCCPPKKVARWLKFVFCFLVLLVLRIFMLWNPNIVQFLWHLKVLFYNPKSLLICFRFHVMVMKLLSLIGFLKPMCEEGKMHNLNDSFKASKCKHFFASIPTFVLNHGQWLVWMIVGMTNNDWRDDWFSPT